jgi:hypothetical protein
MRNSLHHNKSDVASPTKLTKEHIMRTRTFSRRAGALAFGVLFALTGTGLGAAHASSIPQDATTSCPAQEIQKVWDGSEQDNWTFETCGNLSEQFSFLVYPNTMFSDAYAHSYRPSVVEIQLKLRDLNYSPLVIDGLYGQQTAGAVTRYQRDHGLIVDGKVGRQTWVSLFGLGSD